VHQSDFKWDGLFLQNFLRLILSWEYDGQVRYFYDEDNDKSIFYELAFRLSNISDNDKAKAARDLAIEIVRFLICFPAHFEKNPKAQGAIYEKVSVGFTCIKEIVAQVLTKNSGSQGGKWQANNSQFDHVISQIAMRTMYLRNTISDVIFSLAEIKLDTEDVDAIIALADGKQEQIREFVQKIRNAVGQLQKVLIYMSVPYKDIDKELIEYKFLAQRIDSNMGRVFVKMYPRGSKLTVLEIPVATPTHDYDKDIIRDRMSWIADNRR
jgi:hypothetical protein